MPRKPFRCLPGCSECCGAHIFFPPETIQKHREDMQIEPMLEVASWRGVQVYTEDGYCAFLNRKTRRCSIYPDRPFTCSTYGILQPCPYLNPDGSHRSQEEIARHRAAIKRLSTFAVSWMERIKHAN